MSESPAAQLLVLAKEPVPGRAKTRLTPPLTPVQAAAVAAACLHDTMTAVASTPARRRAVILEGAAGDWLPVGVTVIAQRTGGLGDRLAAAFSDAWSALPLPMLLIGMDTPQVTPAMLGSALSALLRPGTDAVLGHAEDGGWWALGLRRPAPGVFEGVPMSTADAGAAQRGRLDALGLVTTALPTLRDVDLAADLEPVAAQQRADAELARLAARLLPLGAAGSDVPAGQPLAAAGCTPGPS